MADTTSKPTPPITCSGCPMTWTGLSRAHCSGCHRTFTGVSAFDKHRVEGYCLWPKTVGLVLREGNLWGAPPMTPEQVAEVWGKP